MAELQDCETGYQELAETIGDVFLALDQRLYCLYWNKATQRLTGIPACQAVGHPVAEVFPEIAEDKATAAYRCVLGTKEPQTFAFEYPVGGTARYYEVRVHPAKCGVYVFFRDVTEQRHSEEILKTSERRLRTALKIGGLGFLEWDLSTDIIDCSEETCRLYGLSAADTPMHIRTMLSMVHPEDKVRVEEALRDAIRGGSEYNIEHRMVRTDGQIIQVHAQAEVIRDAGGNSILLGTVIDITERKRTEERLKYLSTHDVLTGLYNRTFFEEERSRLDRGRRFPVSIIVADLDSLKATNDRLGHAVGDDLLRRAAGVLKEAFRAEEVVARIGGDEFAVLLPGADTAVVKSRLAQIQSRLAAHNASSDGPPCILSMGASTAETPGLLDEALKLADRHMYQEKIRHKSVPEWYSGSDHKEQRARPDES